MAPASGWARGASAGPGLKLITSFKGKNFVAVQNNSGQVSEVEPAVGKSYSNTAIV